MMHKILKKIVNWFNYKLVNKNFFYNNKTLESSSVIEMKLILQNLFNKNKIKTLIQIGANDGVSFDHLNFFIKKFGPKSILVEPILENFDLLKKNYKNYENIIFENSAISINEEIKFLYKVKDDSKKYYSNHIPAIPSFDKKHLLNHGVKNSHIIRQSIKSISLKNLFDKNKIKNLDLLYIDAEGYDGKIVMDFLNNFEIKPIIIFEYIHVKNILFENILNKLKEKEYFYFKISENICCVPKNNNFILDLNSR